VQHLLPCLASWPSFPNLALAIASADGVKAWWAKKEAKERRREGRAADVDEGRAADVDADAEGLGDAVADGSADTKSEL
jgi:hypothetical protein